MEKPWLVLLVSLIIGVVLVGARIITDVEHLDQETPSVQETEGTLPQIFESVTPEKAFTLIQDNQGNPGFVIIDVRTPEEFAEGHIDGAINIDYESETFRNATESLDGNKTYLICYSFYYSCFTCGSIEGSYLALDVIKELDFREVYYMTRSIDDWKAVGLPVVR